MVTVICTCLLGPALTNIAVSTKGWPRRGVPGTQEPAQKHLRCSIRSPRGNTRYGIPNHNITANPPSAHVLFRGRRARRRSAALPEGNPYEAGANVRSLFPLHKVTPSQIRSQPRQVKTNAIKSHQQRQEPPFLLYQKYPDAAPFQLLTLAGAPKSPSIPSDWAARGFLSEAVKACGECGWPAVGPRQWPWRRMVHAVDRPRGRHGRAGEQVRQETGRNPRVR